MNLKLLVGIVLFVVGIVLAVAGIAGVGQPPPAETVMVTEGGVSGVQTEGRAGGLMVPIFAALSLALGGVLIGLSVGNWKNPRTHVQPGDEKVNPEGYHKMKHV